MKALYETYDNVIVISTGNGFYVVVGSDNKRIGFTKDLEKAIELADKSE